jgi:3-hydroxymyristoyl/3-hydroxydecanoyl-(acyl carrier protein) dehydratase
VLLGRADRIVKIGEKRLSLPAMEGDLEAHPRVSEAALVVLPHNGEDRVHAVVALDATGREQLNAGGRRTLGAAFGVHLAAKWDRVLVPRLWRYVDELPRDAQGKLPRSALEALFASKRRDAKVLDERRDAESLERRLEVPDDLVYLNGHFDAFPVVAGVVQLRWVRDAARDLLGHEPIARALEALKFPEPLLPGQLLTLRVEMSADRLRFRLFEGERTFASGRWLLGATS